MGDGVLWGQNSDADDSFKSCGHFCWSVSLCMKRRQNYPNSGSLIRKVWMLKTKKLTNGSFGEKQIHSREGCDDDCSDWWCQWLWCVMMIWGQSDQMWCKDSNCRPNHTPSLIICLFLKIVVEEIPSLDTDAEMPVRVQVTLAKTTTTTTITTIYSSNLNPTSIARELWNV